MVAALVDLFAVHDPTDRYDMSWFPPALWAVSFRCISMGFLFFFLFSLPSKADVVEAAYTLLQSKLGSVRDFVSLQRAHQEFLATLRAKFYIDNLEISQVRLVLITRITFTRLESILWGRPARATPCLSSVAGELNGCAP